jgi:L-ribulose-5-phosphate 3-epimerase
MRLGAMVPERDHDKAIAAVRRLGLSGTGLILDEACTPEQARDIGQRYAAAGIALAQVGCYTNLECAPGAFRERQMERLKRTIALAAEAGSRCVVSGTGHMDREKQEAVFAAHPDNWSDKAMARLTESCAEAASAASGVGIAFCVECWSITTLNTPGKLAELVRRVGTQGFGILLDPVNLMSLDTYFENSRVIRECFDLLGDAIRIVHAKDTLLVESSFTYHMSEAVPGDGILDYETLLRCMDTLQDAETPLVIEHLSEYSDIERARDYIRDVGTRGGAVL